MSASSWRDLWPLEPAVTYLNHGSFGACPYPVLEYQAELRARLERGPVAFMVRELEARLDENRSALAQFVGADPETLVFVANATTGINTVLQSLDLASGDELLVSNHEYNACRNALDEVAARTRARVVVVEVPFPISRPDEVLGAFVSSMSARTKLVLIDHVTSQTALVMPVAEVVEAARKRGIETLIDGAHAPGMVPLNLQALGATFYTGNCHKWMCTPKSAGFLVVPHAWQSRIRPLVISHGRNAARTDRSRFRLEFDWIGTQDPTPALCVARAIDFMGSLLPGGWDELRSSNRALALAARARIERALGLNDSEVPAPSSMIGSMASVDLPQSIRARCDGVGPMPATGSALDSDSLQDWLWRFRGFEVPIIAWPTPSRRLLRVSAQIYNTIEDYDRLAGCLAEMRDITT